MKKGIILIILLCSIIMCSKVKASVMDGNLYQEYEILNSESTGILDMSLPSQGVAEITINFDHLYIASNKANYMVINYTKYMKHWDSGDINNGTGTIYDNELGDFTLTARIRAVNQVTQVETWVNCEVADNLIICPLKQNIKYTKLSILAIVPASQPAPPSYTSIKICVFSKTQLYQTQATTIITNQNDNTQQIMDTNTTYNNNATQDYTNQTNEMDNITNAEDTLMNNLDFNTTDMNITINPNASTFIWNIVDALRLMSTKIVLLMTSILSIGVIKLVLNR